MERTCIKSFKAIWVTNSKTGTIPSEARNEVPLLGNPQYEDTVEVIFYNFQQYLMLVEEAENEWERRN